MLPGVPIRVAYEPYGSKVIYENAATTFYNFSMSFPQDIPGANPDGFSFVALCPICKRKHEVGCSRTQLASEGILCICCIYAGDKWIASAEEKRKIRKLVADCAA
jgi:hypothetical protein